MANTIIRLKKSSVASHLPDPAQLEYGEIALNYADGKIFYKDATGNVQQISGSANSFSTISANGTYLVSTSPTSILSINPGNNIEIQGDFITDAFTIAANLKSVFDIANAAFDRANSSNDVLYVAAAYNTANAGNSSANQAGIIANAAFDRANSLNGAAAVVAAYDTANAAFDKANNAQTNSFTTISVTGQSNIVASINDTLNFTTGSGINILTNAVSKTVSFSIPPGTYSGDYGFIYETVTAANDYGSI